MFVYFGQMQLEKKKRLAHRLLTLSHEEGEVVTSVRTSPLNSLNGREAKLNIIDPEVLALHWKSQSFFLRGLLSFIKAGMCMIAVKRALHPFPLCQTRRNPESLKGSMPNSDL